MNDVRDGPIDREHRVGVVDIGSNSIRLVVYEGDRRMPIPIFNEKALCRLGATLSESGRLSQSGRVHAIVNLSRFIQLAASMNLSRLDIVATAAVRDAANGGEFVDELENRFGGKVRVLSGDEEARLSALGVISAFPDADGLVGDLGGGSLELIDVRNGEPVRSASLPLGPLRLQTLTRSNRKSLVRHIDRQLQDLPWLEDLADRTFYAVGGVWRSLARAHMEMSEYPLQVIQDYTIARQAARSFLSRLSRVDRLPIDIIPGVARRRLDAVPLGALLMSRVLRLGNPEQVVFSAFGLREGVLFDRLPQAERRLDPLRASCSDIASRSGRFPTIAPVAERWMRGLFPQASASEQRLIDVAAMLSDLAWAEHPRYRGEHAFYKVLRLPVVGMSHFERVFVARAIFAATRACQRSGPDPGPHLAGQQPGSKGAGDRTGAAAGGEPVGRVAGIAGKNRSPPIS